MSDEERDLTIRRILVALDASPHSLAALDAAVELAARFEAQLEGLYVEDINLLRLAELPFAQEVGLFSARRRRLDLQELERQLRAQTVRIQRTFRGATAQAEITCTFRVSRGAVASEVVTAASGSDVVILGRSGWTLTPSRRLGSTVRQILHQAPGMALILQQGSRLSPPVLVVYDGSPLGHKALGAAVALLEAGDHLVVLLLTDGLARAEVLRQEAGEALRAYDLDLRYRVLSESNVPRLVRLIHAEQGGTLVLPARLALFEEEALLLLLDEVDIPVLLVR
jgi:nucleotide-binding universal stress UspA family protein